MQRTGSWSHLFWIRFGCINGINKCFQINAPYPGSNFRGGTEVNVPDVLTLFQLHDEISKQSVAMLYNKMKFMYLITQIIIQHRQDNE